MKRLFALLVVALSVACGSDTPVAPAPVVPLCQRNNTADVALANQSSVTLDLIIDGVRQGTISPGQTSTTVTVAAGVAHTVVSRLTNTATNVCSASPIFAQCSTQTLTCRP